MKGRLSKGGEAAPAPGQANCPGRLPFPRAGMMQAMPGDLNGRQLNCLNKKKTESEAETV